MFKGYWLDDYTFICPAVDKDGMILWCKLTTTLPRDKDGTIKFDPVSGKGFDLEIINPHNFEWNGYKLSLEVN